MLADAAKTLLPPLDLHLRRVSPANASPSPSRPAPLSGFAGHAEGSGFGLALRTLRRVGNNLSDSLRLRHIDRVAAGFFDDGCAGAF